MCPKNCEPRIVEPCHQSRRREPHDLPKIFHSFEATPQRPFLLLEHWQRKSTHRFRQRPESQQECTLSTKIRLPTRALSLRQWPCLFLPASKLEEEASLRNWKFDTAKYSQSKGHAELNFECRPRSSCRYRETPFQQWFEHSTSKRDAIRPDLNRSSQKPQQGHWRHRNRESLGWKQEQFAYSFAVTCRGLDPNFWQMRHEKFPWEPPDRVSTTVRPLQSARAR